MTFLASEMASDMTSTVASSITSRLTHSAMPHYCAGLFELVIIYELSEHAGDIGRVVAAIILLSFVPIAD